MAANTILHSSTFGALTRNAGEVLGVFGEVTIPSGEPLALRGYDSSLRLQDLVELENLVRKLHSPQWPREFPAVNEDMRKAGEKKFEVYCSRCHAAIDRTDPNRKVKAVKTPLDDVNTDRMMATNFSRRKAKTGPLQGRVISPPLPQIFGAEASGSEILSHVVLGVIRNGPFNEYERSDVLTLRKAAVSHGAEENLVYKGRPLNGIWATAPYLHNGSVPNLYQLLLPAEKRVNQFYVGRREFDPKNVGFVTAQFEGGFQFRTTSADGKPIVGNSNAGHEYGTGKKKAEGGDDLPALTDEERWQLVEYMKSL
jgi:hypothetical protein